MENRHPLIEACRSGSSKSVKALIAAGSDVNVQLGNRHPLIEACRMNSVESVKALIAAGSDVNVQLDNRHPLIEACKCYTSESVKALIAAGSNVNVQLGNRHPLIEACRHGYSLESVKALIAAGANVNVQLDNRHPLIEACRSHSPEFVKVLIAAGSDVNIQLDNRHPLIEACRSQSPESVKVLIAAGSDVNVQLDNRHPLIEACGNYLSHSAKALIVAGSDVNVQLGNRHPLIEACRSDSPESVKVLIAAGSDVNVQLDNRHPLIEACRNYSPESIEVLIAAGSDVNVQLDNCHPLLECCRSLASESIKAFIAAISVVNVQLHHRHPLIEAYRTCSTESVKALIAAGSDVNVQLDNRHPLIEACYSAESVKALVAAGSDVNVQLDNRHPLIEACQIGVPESVEALIAAGADVNVQLDGKTAAVVNNKQIESNKLKDIRVCCYVDVARRYKIHEILSMQNKEDVVDRMKADTKGLLHDGRKEQYRRAIDYYIAGLPPVKIGPIFHLTNDEAETRITAFKSGTEQNFSLRIHFVGYTTAGKTSLMLQMFTIPFDPKNISSTDGISISLYQCCIDIATGKWYRVLHEERNQILQRIKLQVKRRPSKQSIHSTVDIASNVLSDVKEQNPEVVSQLPTTPKDVPDINVEKNPEAVSRSPTNPKHTLEAKFDHSKQKINYRHLKGQLKEMEKLYCDRKPYQAAVRGFDHAGQTLYYTLHQLFLSQKGINIIVMDGSKDFDEIINDEDIRQLGRNEIKKKRNDSVPGKIKGNSKDFFRFWANSLRYYLPNDNLKQVIVVLTHKDLIDDEAELQTKIDKVIEMIDEMKLCDMFFGKIFSVNCNNPNDKDLVELRRVVLDMSKTRKDWGELMPNRWILLENKLMNMREKGKKVMTLEEVKMLNQTNEPALQSREEILLFLKIQHENGTLLHFADDRLQKMVILEAQWLIDSLVAIIHARPFLDAKFQNERKLLHKKGILYKEFMERVWKQNNDKTFYQFKDQLITLMDHLDLISSPQLYNNRNDDQAAPYFVVPCMLSTSPENYFSEYLKSCSSASTPLSYKFKNNFLPTATVYRLLAACISKYGESVESNGSTFCDAAKNTLFCNGGVFRISERHYLLLEATYASIIVKVTTFAQDKTDPEVCHQIRNFINETLDSIITNQKSSSKYTVAISCGRGDISEEFQACKWEELIKKPTVVCHNHGVAPHVVESRQLLQQWLVEPSASSNIHGRDENNVPKQAFGQPFHKLHDNALTFPAIKAYVNAEFNRSIGFLKAGSSSGTCFRVGNQRYVMTAYHVVKDVIDEMISQLAYRLIRDTTNHQQLLTDVAGILEVAHQRMDDADLAMESILRTYFARTPSEIKVSNLLIRLRETVNNDVIDRLTERLNSSLWKSVCTVEFDEQTTKFSFEYDIPFTDKVNDIIIMKISGDEGLPPPCILDTANPPKEVDILGFPKDKILHMDFKCPVYNDPESKQNAIQKAKQWWELECNLQICPETITCDFDIPASKVIVNTSESFEYGVSGSPMTKVDLDRRLPLVCMMYQCGFPNFYYIDKLSGQCHPPIYARFEGGISMRKISMLLAEAGKQDLIQDIFPH